MNLSYQILKERYIDLRKSHKTLHDEVLRLQQENQQLKQKYLNEVADYESEKSKNQRAIEVIENSYYSKNTTNIDDIAISSDKLIQVRKILKGENNEY